MPRYARRTSSRPRRMDWGSAEVVATISAFNNDRGWYLDPETQRSSFVDPTVIRHLFSTVIHQNTNNFGAAGLVAVGLIAWDGIDATLPTPSPRPISDGNLDWIMRHVQGVPPFQQAGALYTFPNCDMLYQSKAMRKLGNDKGLLVCWEVTAGASFTFVSDIRFLLKE